MLQGLTRDRFVDLCFFNSLVIFSSSELGSRGLLYSSSSSLSELSFSFSVSESCFFLADAISAACRFRHLVRLFWNQTWARPGLGSARLGLGPGSAQLGRAAPARPFPSLAQRGLRLPPVRGRAARTARGDRGDALGSPRLLRDGAGRQ